jgi:signal transduction histidine kinase
MDTADDEIGILSQRLYEAMQRQRASESEAVLARKVAETANQEKSKFLSRMSHELRTPLNAVLGFAQLLEMDADASQMDSLYQIRRAGRHLLDLINEVLDISRIESGQMALSQEPVLVADLILEAVELMNPMAAEHSVTLSAITTGAIVTFKQTDNVANR